jgi:mannose-1-phosphate guanylyltransferase
MTGKKKRKPEKKLATDRSIYGVVLAGGSGTRFWPKSRLKSPKQLCALGNQKASMLEITLDRFAPLVAPSRRMIVTHREQLAATRKTAGKKCPLLIPEPEARNTAPALALAALAIEKACGGEDSTTEEPVMISMHADHVITDIENFNEVIQRAVTIARTGRLTLLGVVPDYPETGYGYIERGHALHLRPLEERGYGYEVAGFREKPDYKTASRYVASGDFLWNSGLFVFPVRTLLRELDRSIPGDMKKLRSCLRKTVRPGQNPFDEARLARVYPRLTKISIDEAVLEKSREIAVVDATFGWQDIGSWDALGKAFPPSDETGNLVYGEAVLIDTENSTIDSDGPLVAAIGLKDMIVVHHKGAILVCPKDRAQDVKLVVETLKAAKRTELI